MNRVLQNASDPSPTLVERLAKDQVLAYGAFFAVIFGAFQWGHALMQGMAHPTLPVSAILGLICLVSLEELDAQINGDWPVVRGTLVLIVMTFIAMVVAAASFYLDGGHHLLHALSLVR